MVTCSTFARYTYELIQMFTGRLASLVVYSWSCRMPRLRNGLQAGTPTLLF